MPPASCGGAAIDAGLAGRWRTGVRGTDPEGSVEMGDFLRPEVREGAAIAPREGTKGDRRGIPAPSRPRMVFEEPESSGLCAPASPPADAGTRLRWSIRSGWGPGSRPCAPAEAERGDPLPTRATPPPPTSAKGAIRKPAARSMPKRFFPSGARTGAAGPERALGGSSAPRFYHGGRISLRR